jgi:hypothetical protein
VIEYGGSWDVHLPLIEFSYNNSYHASIKARRLRHSTGGNVGRQFVGSKLVKDN